MALESYQIAQINAYADGELNVEACIEVQRLLSESEEAVLVLNNINTLKSTIKMSANSEVSDDFKKRLKLQLAQPERTQRRESSFSFPVAAAVAVVIIMFSMFWSNAGKIDLISETVATIGEPVNYGNDVMQYVSTSHDKMLSNDGPMVKDDNLKLITTQINKQLDGSYKKDDFKITAKYKGFCPCSIPNISGSKRLSYVVEGEQEDEFVSLYIINTPNQVDCATLKSVFSKDRIYKVGKCKNDFSVIQWQTSKFNYFMVSKVGSEKLIELMDQILR